MDRLIEFAMNHPFLVGGFLALLAAFITLETRRGGKSVSPQQLTNLVNRDEALVLDVRDTKEFREGHITGSKNIPYSSLQSKLGEIEKHKEQPIILVCKMGQHAGAAGRILSGAGFKDVRRLSGGVSGWKADGLPLVS
ncbi:MAG: rhodanese-like domain-containing protein [Pseudomonadales bacterium]|nr:rhodanese-like domain-containing protein [Pseudomonadales bacterium]